VEDKREEEALGEPAPKTVPVEEGGRNGLVFGFVFRVGRFRWVADVEDGR
jgi:hypothetical protein